MVLIFTVFHLIIVLLDQIVSLSHHFPSSCPSPSKYFPSEITNTPYSSMEWNDLVWVSQQIILTERHDGDLT